MTVRYAFSIALGAVVTFGLLFLMQLLIATGRGALTEAALKFKYRPRIIDGEAVEVPGVRKGS